MPSSAEGKSATFATQYKQMQERLLAAKAGTIEEQLAKTERDAPELHAAFATLALLLRHGVIDEPCHFCDD